MGLHLMPAFRSPDDVRVGIWDFTCERSVLRLRRRGSLEPVPDFYRRRGGTTSCAPVYRSATDTHSHSHLYLSVIQIVNSEGGYTRSSENPQKTLKVRAPDRSGRLAYMDHQFRTRT